GEVLCERPDLAAVDQAMPGHDAVARHLLGLHAEVGAPVGDETIDFLEGPRVEEQVDALAGRQPSGLMLPPAASLAAAFVRSSLEVREPGERVHHTRAACAFSQSWRNFARPMSVSGCLRQASITAGGQVQTSAPMRAASTMCIGPRTLATRISVGNSCAS